MPRISRRIAAEDLLRPYSLASLSAAAAARGIDPAHKTKSKLIQVLAKSLYDAETIAALLKRLEPREREVLDRVVLLGGEVLTASLRHQLGSEGAVDAPGIDRRSVPMAGNGAKGRFETIVARLSQLGLLFSTNLGPYREHVEWGVIGQQLFIPEGVMQHLPAPAIPVETTAAPATEILTSRDDVLRDIYMLVAAVRDEPVPLSARGLIPKRHLGRIDGSFRRPEGIDGVRSESDLGRLPFLRGLAEDLRLVAQGARGLSAGDAVPVFLSQAPGLRQRRLYDAYLRTRRWSELSRLRGFTISPRAKLTGPKIAAARKVVLDEVATLPVDSWIPTRHLVDRIRRRAFEFLIERNWQYSHYYYGNSFYSDPEPYAGTNSLGLSFSARDDGRPPDWDSVEGEFIRGTVEALHWLGVLDLGFDGSGEASLFRLTEAGGRIVRGEVPPSMPPPANVVVQPNFQVLVFEPTGEDVLFTLDRIAQRVRAEQVVEYYLTHSAIYDAQRAGMEIGDVIAFLERVGTTPLPQNVRRSLEEWGAGHQRVLVRRGLAAMEVADGRLLDELAADPELATLLGRRVSERVMLVPAANIEALRRRLVSEPSFPLPALTEGNDARGEGSVRIDASGRVDFGQPLASMYVRAALRPFVDEEPDGSMRLTPAALRRAIEPVRDRPGMSADEILAVLQRLHAGPLANEVVVLVRRWAREWGRGTISQAALLQVEHAEIMSALLTDAELQPHLQPVAGNPTLAIVVAGEVGKVRAMLKERGMDLGAPPETAATFGRNA